MGGIGAAALLDFFGYVPDAETQTETVMNVFFIENVTLPMIIFAISIALMLVIGRYEKRLPAMQKDLAARKASAAN